MTVVPAKRRAEARRLTLLCAAVYFCSYLTRLDYGAVMVEMVRAEGFSRVDASAALTSEGQPKPKDEHTIPRLVQAAIAHVDADQRPLLLSNIVVTGGSTLLHKFNDRLNFEINAIYPSTRNKLIAPGSVVERKYAAWIGGSILTSLGSFHQLWISKKEYEEHGASIVEKRCK